MSLGRKCPLSLGVTVSEVTSGIQGSFVPLLEAGAGLGVAGGGEEGGRSLAKDPAPAADSEAGSPVSFAGTHFFPGSPGLSWTLHSHLGQSAFM